MATFLSRINSGRGEVPDINISSTRTCQSPGRGLASPQKTEGQRGTLSGPSEDTGPPAKEDPMNPLISTKTDYVKRFGCNRYVMEATP